MAAAGTLRMAGQISGFLTGPQTLQLAWDITNGSPAHFKFNLTANIATPISIPTGARVIVIVPPAGNTVDWGLTADGQSVFVMDPVLPLVLPAKNQTAVILVAISQDIMGLELWAA